MESLINEVGKQRANYDEVWVENVRDKYCRKAQDITDTQNRFFSQYWQGYAWSAIIGFIKNRRSNLLPSSKNSFGNFDIIIKNAPSVLLCLIYLAISKSDSDYEILDRPQEIALIISEYAKGGAEYIKEIKETPGMENFFNSEDDFLNELLERKKD